MQFAEAAQDGIARQILCLSTRGDGRYRFSKDRVEGRIRPPVTKPTDGQGGDLDTQGSNLGRQGKPHGFVPSRRHGTASLGPGWMFSVRIKREHREIVHGLPLALCLCRFFTGMQGKRHPSTAGPHDDRLWLLLGVHLFHTDVGIAAAAIALSWHEGSNWALSWIRRWNINCIFPNTNIPQ
jgi:hypothetical protein